jgi:anti-sigma B factor antagonist
MKITHTPPNTLNVSNFTEITAANATQIRDSIRAALQPAHRVLDLDLSSVTFLDSSGLGVLVALHKTLRARDGQVRLLKPAPNVLQVLELTRLHRIFEIVSQ